MNVLIKSAAGITQVSADSKLLSQRKIFIEGSIDDESACEFAKKVMLLNIEDKNKFIDVLINSAGGEINPGMMMYDIIQTNPAPIRLFCVGKAYSMGAVLFASGNHGRYILPHSELMLHEPLITNMSGGNSSSVKSISDSLLETRNQLNKILAKHSGKSVEEVENATSYDHYFSPEESIKFGLCDKIIGFDMLMEDRWEKKL